MRRARRLLFLACLLTAVAVAPVHANEQSPRQATEPIRLHPDNPNYFLFRGRPTVLVSSAEHYGAVINLDFDYVRYLNELQRRGFNVTRVFSGSFVEPASANPLGYENTLAPRPGRYLAPWARTGVAGYRVGGGKFDLTRWDRRYFARLRDFVREAGRRGVVVELTLFSAYYNEVNWRTSPLQAGNNVNGVGGRPFHRVYEVRGNARLLAAQEALVRKLVRELRPFDNVIFEILNEPWAGPCDMTAPSCSMRQWQDRIISLIWNEESGRARHLISEDVGHGVNSVHGPQNVRLRTPNRLVSVYEYHYAQAVAARANLRLGKVIGNNETGFRGLDERVYRTEAWMFLLAGGGLLNNLDWSFTPDHEDGRSVEFRTAFLPFGDRAGSGGEPLQTQIAFLKRFLTRLPFVRMRPRPELVTDTAPRRVAASVLAEPGRTYAVYFPRGPVRRFSLRLSEGSYRLAWSDPRTGRMLRIDRVRHGGGIRRLLPPAFDEDLALAVRRSG